MGRRASTGLAAAAVLFSSSLLAQNVKRQVLDSGGQISTGSGQRLETAQGQLGGGIGTEPSNKVYSGYIQTNHAPGTVTNLLAVRSSTTNAVQLTWTEPGWDGFLGQASVIVVKVSSSPLTTQALFDSASTYATLSAQSPGSTESRLVSGLSSSATWFFAVEARNLAQIQGALSNAASTTTFSPAVLPPGPPELHAFALSSSTIRWNWTPDATGGPADFFFLYSTNGVLISQISGSATYYLENILSTNTVASRYLEAMNLGGQAFSSTVTVATPVTFTFGGGGISSGTIYRPDISTDPVVDIPAGASPATSTDTVRWLFSLKPATEPLVDDTPNHITQANTKLATTLQGAPASVSEFIVTINDVRYHGTFPQMITVYVYYPDANNDGIVDGTNPPVRADTLKMYTLNETTNDWELVSNSVLDKTIHAVKAQVPHLSIYTALGTISAPDLNNVKVYPNPWEPGTGGPQDSANVVFENLTDLATIKVFTLTGRLVKRIEKVAADGNAKFWDGTNDDGRKVASGVYYYLVTNPAGNVAHGRVAVVR